MANDKIRVGLIGASPDRGWASGAHVPALQALPDYALTAVSSLRRESSEAAARKWGARAAYTDAGELIADPEVDLVVVSVKCPDHYAPVRAALEAGKPVFCEWPLAANMDEVRELAALARAKSVRTFIGLQARAAPAAAYARDLVRQGYVGRLLGATVVSAASGRTEVTNLSHAYAADKRFGNSALTIAGGHTLDALCFVAGEEFREVAGVVKLHFTRQRIIETGEMIDKDTPDHVSVAGLLESGATASVHVQAGVSRGPGVRLEIRGTHGDLCLSSSGPHIVEMSDLRLAGAQRVEGAAPGAWQPFEELPIPDSYRPVAAIAPASWAYNVAALYDMISSDLRAGTHLAPDFEVALKRHTLLDAIATASDTGVRQVLT